MVFTYGTPIAARKKVLIVSRLSVNVVSEHGNHVFVSLRRG